MQISFAGFCLFSLENLFDLLSFQVIVAVINAVRIEEKNVAPVHQGDLIRVKRGHLTLAQCDGDIPASVRMVFGISSPSEGNCTMRDHPISMNFSYSAENTSGGGWPKLTKRNNPSGRISPYTMVAISRELSSASEPSAFLAVTDCASLSNYFEYVSRSFTVRVEFAKHSGMKGVVHGRRDLGCDVP